MKNLITTTTVLFALSIVILSSCSTPDPKAQLEKLRKQKQDIETQIAALEETLAKSDTSVDLKAVEVSVTAMKPSIFKSYIEVQARVDADENRFFVERHARYHYTCSGKSG
jgi:membrane fusion protein, multidrug efflux system